MKDILNLIMIGVVLLYIIMLIIEIYTNSKLRISNEELKNKLKDDIHDLNDTVDYNKVYLDAKLQSLECEKCCVINKPNLIISKKDMFLGDFVARNNYKLDNPCEYCDGNNICIAKSEDYFLKKFEKRKMSEKQQLYKDIGAMCYNKIIKEA